MVLCCLRLESSEEEPAQVMVCESCREEDRTIHAAKLYKPPCRL